MKQGTSIKLTKLAAVANPQAPTPAWDGYRPGEDNGDVSLPIEYTAEGTLRADIKVGEGIALHRTSRNGIAITGFLDTTPLTSWDGKKATTQNSVYLVEALFPESSSMTGNPLSS